MKMSKSKTFSQLIFLIKLFAEILTTATTTTGQQQHLQQLLQIVVSLQQQQQQYLAVFSAVFILAQQ